MKRHSKDEVICGEIPLAMIQTLDNSKVALCCTNCAAFLGDWTTQAQMIVGNKKRKMQGIKELLQFKKAYQCSNNGNCGGIFCSESCRLASQWSHHALECRCSFNVPELRDDASTNALIVEFLSHAEKTEEIFLAVGRVISTLLMHILRDSLICIQKAAIFLLTDGVEKVLESFVWLEEECLNNLELTSSVKQTVLKSVEWFTKSFPQHPFQNRSSSEYSVDNIRNFAPQGLRDTACESWLLLHSALIEKGVSSTLFGPLLSKSFFAEVLGALESHLHSVSATANPLLPHLVEYLSNRNPAHVAGSQEPPEEEIFLQHLLVGSDETQREKLLSNKLLLISELNSLANGTGSVASATGHDNGIFTFDNSACHSTFMVLLPRVSRTAVHSCVPSAHITTTAAGSLLLSPDRLVVDLPPLRETYQLQCLQEAQNRKSLRVDIVSLRDCNIGEESGEQLSISYVDDNIVGGANDLESRHAQLEARFPALSKMKTGSPLCSCSRCVFEKASFGQIGSPGVDTLKEVIKGFSSHQLLNVGHMCMQQHAYDNAKLLYTTLLERLCGKTCARCLAESSGEKVTETRSSSTDGKLVVIADATLSQIAGDAFHALGAAYLERSGDWERARLVWELGIQVAPLHSQLIAEVKKVHSYPTAKVRVKPCASVLLSVNEVQDLLKELPDQFTFRCASPESVLAFERFDALIRDTHYEILQSSDNGYSTALPDEGTNSKSTEIPPFLGLPVEVSKGVVLTTTTSSVSQVFLTSRQQPLLTAAECRHVIEATESFAAQSGGWSTSRHYAVPTTDIPVHIIKSSTSVAAGNGGGEVLGGESLLTWFNNIFTNRLAPLLASQYQGLFANGGPIRVAIHDAFVVKYEAVSGEANSGLDDATGGEGMKSVKLAGQRYLPLHCDQSSHSFTISLNASADYEGGGTYFPAMGSVLRPGCGQVLSFPGGTVLHGGEPISRGTRYILAVFAYLAGPSPPEPGLAEGTCSANVLSDRYTAQQSEPAAEDACVSGIKKRTLESGEQSPCSAKKVATIANSFNIDANTEISSEKKIHSFNFML